MRSIGVLLVIAGCHTGGPMMIDGGVGSDPDGPKGALGLTISWNADPELPGPVTDKITVLDATFQLEYLQLVSDVGADDRTTHPRFQLHWSDNGMPDDDVFPDAPVATYQKISISMRSGQLQPAYQIQGTWRDDDEHETKPFVIVDNVPMLTIPIDCDEMLSAGGSVMIPIRMDLKQAIGNVDFGKFTPQGPLLVLSSGPELMSVRGKLMRSFVLDHK